MREKVRGKREEREIESASLFESACKANGKYFEVIITVRKGIDDMANSW